MTKILIATLAILVVILLTILTIKYFSQTTRTKTELNQVIFFSYACLAYGVIYDSIRVISLMFSLELNESIDLLGFYIKIFLFFLVFSGILRIMTIFNKQSGHEYKHDTWIREIYFLPLIIFTIVNATTYHVTATDAIGFYTYQIAPSLNIIAFLCYTPCLIYVISRIKMVVNELKNKALAKQSLIFVSIIAILIVERYLNISFYYFFFSYSTFLTIFDLTLISVVIVATLILFYKNPNLLGAISTYLNVRSVYLLNKQGGQIIFRHQFQEELEKHLSIPDQLLLGGLIFAVSTGLETTLKTYGKMEAIRIGDITLLFKHGRYTLGILFTTEDNSMHHLQLLLLMQRFESHYGSTLEKWNGDLSRYDPNLIERWALEIFRQA